MPKKDILYRDRWDCVLVTPVVRKPKTPSTTHVYIDTYPTILERCDDLDSKPIKSINSELLVEGLPNINYVGRGYPSCFGLTRTDTDSHYIGFDVESAKLERDMPDVISVIEGWLEAESYRHAARIKERNPSVDVQIIERKTFIGPCDDCIHRRVCINSLIPQDNSYCPNYQYDDTTTRPHS